MPTMMPTSCFLDSQSALGFVPQPIQGMPLNESFVIGTLVHYNCPIVGGYVSEVELTIPIRFASGVFDGSARFQLELHETSNAAGSCPYPSTTPCSDRLRWTSLTTPDSFVINNRRFALSLLGFSSNADPSRFSLVSQFYSEERLSNIAYLVATLTEAPLCEGGFDVCDVCGGDGSSCAPFGCDGVRGSGLEYDQCGVCNGANRCVDCAGMLYGTRVYDRCNVCNGDGQSCVDCRAVLFGTARYDQCDVCDGNGVSCVDCAGVPFGTKVIDVCGVCDGSNIACVLTYDCFGVLNGSARRDQCGVCNGNGSSCVDCHGVANGTAVVDWCNVCSGDGSSCVDCAGVRNGTNVRDKCGVCGGNDNTCRGCDGVPLSGFVYDPCGVCQKQLPDGSFASLSCVWGCDRRPFAPYKVLDRCGICGGANLCSPEPTPAATGMPPLVTIPESRTTTRDFNENPAPMTSTVAANASMTSAVTASLPTTTTTVVVSLVDAAIRRTTATFAMDDTHPTLVPELENDSALIGGVVGGIIIALLLVVNAGLVIVINLRKRRAKQAAANILCESGDAQPSHYVEHVAVASPALQHNYDALEPDEVAATSHVDANVDSTMLAVGGETGTLRKRQSVYHSAVPEAGQVFSSSSVQNAPSQRHSDESARAADTVVAAPTMSTTKSKTKKGERRRQQKATLIRRSARPVATEVLYIPIEEIEIGKRLGEGMFGVVFRGRWHDKRVAVKQVKSSRTVDGNLAIADFEAEVSKMVTTTFHENLVQLYGVTTLESGDMAAVVEYCAKGSLVDALYGDKAREWTVPELYSVAHDAASGVAHLHRQGVIHRDIAARNVLLSKHGVAKVADFGMARLLAEDLYSEQTTLNTVGPLRWMAPEQMERRAYSRASDVFAFGVLLFEIFKREVPWKGETNIVTATKVMQGERMNVSSHKIPRKAAALMLECWAHEPAERPSMKRVQRLLHENVSSSDESATESS